MSTPELSAPTNRSGLSRESIIDAAVGLADSGGIDAVTIRRVASALNVTPMALYWHFRNKDELLAGMADWVYGAMDFDLDPAAPWLARLRSLLEAEIAVLRAHPALASLVVTYGGVSEHILTAMETALGILFDGGFSPEESVQVIQHIELAAVNLVLRESKATVPDGAATAENERGAQTALLALPMKTFPNVHRAAAPLSRCLDPADYYEFGLDLLLAGVEAMARRHHPDT